MDISLNTGEDFQAIVTLSDFNNATLNLSSYSVYSSMKKSYITSNVAASFVCTILDAANGVISLALDHTITANLNPQRYLYDVVLIQNTSNTISRVLEGLVYVTPHVTAIP